MAINSLEYSEIVCLAVKKEKFNSKRRVYTIAANIRARNYLTKKKKQKKKGD